MVRRKKGLAAQKGLVALVALVSVGVLGYFTFMVVDEQSNAQFEEGTHFETLATPRRVRGDAIEVMEFFSYGCVSNSAKQAPGKPYHHTEDGFRTQKEALNDPLAGTSFGFIQQDLLPPCSKLTFRQGM